jgi:hypothetical protein
LILKVIIVIITIIIIKKLRYQIDAAPSSEEMGIYNELYTLLVQPNARLLETLEQYKPASDYIRNAIATPNEETEDKAWEAVLPTVDMLRDFYEFSSELGND